MEKDKVIKRLSLGEVRSKTKSEKATIALADLKKTHKVERDQMQAAYEGNMTKAKQEYEKNVTTMENRHKRELDKVGKKLTKKNRKLAKLKEQKKDQASAAQKARWENYHKAYAKAEADHKGSFEKEMAKLEKDHKKTIDAMGKASDAEKECCQAALEKAQSDLKISKEKQKDMAAELRFYQDKEMREEEALEELEESTKASAHSGSKRQAEEGDEEVIFDVDFDLHDEGKSNMWGFKIRQMIVKLLVVGLSPAHIGPTITTITGKSICLPSDRFMRQMRSEMRIIVETLAARAAADPEVRIPDPLYLLSFKIILLTVYKSCCSRLYGGSSHSTARVKTARTT